ncbi:DegV family protein [Kineosporia sp. R_H_3]|uniref:DegV family protein n=1 Tax=Kineosporia sp. R_H_3 TaxID=1961848 RepID=UPI000B4ADA05|nr:DegV family protein [Kineosporia sp. R_H_3]
MPAHAAVAVVTDSTAYLPADLVAEHGLTVVPLTVVVGGRSLAEGIEVTSAEVAQALREWRPVTTSRPAPQQFVEAYLALAEQGIGEIVSVHLSADLSGTVDAARTAAGQVAGKVAVTVVDARHLGMALGYAAISAARAVAAGADGAAAAEQARRTAYTASAWFYVDTLEYLRRGGRIGAAAAMVGSALSVKPILHVVDGRLEPLDRVRTASRALARLEELVVEESGGRAVDLAVQHLASPDRAEQLAERLRSRVPGVRGMVVNEVGAVVGAHVGPGMLGVVVSPA